MSEQKPERIAKVLARAGLCSRREAERWIADGRVSVDGHRLDSPAVTVGPENRVVVDGKPLPVKAETRLWRYHKPAGLVTSHKDPEGRATVFNSLPKELGRVISVGRLDLNSEGLLLLTNDGELARRLELPATGWVRRYRVRVHGRVDAKRLEVLAAGVTVAGVRYGPIEAGLDSQSGANAWLTVSLAEGKNREIRKVMESLELPVSRLIRLAYGPFQLGKLGRGEISEVSAHVLAEQVPGGATDGTPAKSRAGWAKSQKSPNKGPRGPRKAARRDKPQDKPRPTHRGPGRAPHGGGGKGKPA